MADQWNPDTTRKWNEFMAIAKPSINEYIGVISAGINCDNLEEVKAVLMDMNDITQQMLGLTMTTIRNLIKFRSEDEWEKLKSSNLNLQELLFLALDPAGGDPC